MRSEIDVQALNRHYESARIKYITGHINREQLAEIVDGKDYKRKKATAIINVCELFSTVCADIFQLLIASEKTDDEFAGELVQRISECDTLRLYVNDQLKELSITYGICVQQISAEWKNNSSKFKTNGETAKYIIDRDNKLSKEQKRIEDLHAINFCLLFYDSLQSKSLASRLGMEARNRSDSALWAASHSAWLISTPPTRATTSPLSLMLL